VKLRDAPTVINPATLEAQQLPPSPNDQARAHASTAPAVSPETPPAALPPDNPHPTPQSD
jgi:hypothetical protein